MEIIEKLKNIMKWLNDNQWLNVIFLLFAILGIIVSIYLYRKGKRRKKPLFSKRSVNVVSDSIQSFGDILVTYLGKPVENLTVTKVAIWNSGNETLNSSDQAPTDKLRIETEEGIQIFKADIIYESNQTNNFKVQINSNIVELTFDFFDQNQGGIVKIIHSGKKSDNLIIKGTFKGVGNIKETKVSSLDFLRPILSISSKNTTEKDKHFSNKTMPWVVLTTGLVVGFLPLFTDIKEKPMSITPVLSIVGAIYSILGLILIFGRKSLPKGFDSFYGDE
jgi:hypothetical protein